eukprot:m.13441 g.13441  ORF g.13441 m.13441 type:complete len:86 (-) comp9733_c0_seq1:447-704(-)
MNFLFGLRSYLHISCLGEVFTKFTNYILFLTSRSNCSLNQSKNNAEKASSALLFGSGPATCINLNRAGSISSHVMKTPCEKLRTY